MRDRNPVIISLGKTIINVGKYIVNKSILLLRKGEDYLNDRMPIWFSNTRYYRDKRIEDKAIESVRNHQIRFATLEDLDIRQVVKESSHSKMTPTGQSIVGEYEGTKEDEAIGENFPPMILNGNWKRVQR